MNHVIEKSVERILDTQREEGRGKTASKGEGRRKCGFMSARGSSHEMHFSVGNAGRQGNNMRNKRCKRKWKEDTKVRLSQVLRCSLKESIPFSGHEPFSKGEKRQRHWNMMPRVPKQAKGEAGTTVLGQDGATVAA